MHILMDVLLVLLFLLSIVTSLLVGIDIGKDGRVSTDTSGKIIINAGAWAFYFALFAFIHSNNL